MKNLTTFFQNFLNYYITCCLFSVRIKNLCFLNVFKKIFFDNLKKIRFFAAHSYYDLKRHTFYSQK